MASYTCELCGNPCGSGFDEMEFGDIHGIACAVCMGWTGKLPAPEVVEFLKKHDPYYEEPKPDKVAVWPPRPIGG